MIKNTACLVSALLLFIGSQAVAQAGAEQSPWFKTAVIYSVDVKTFCDSDADGIGDFNGLTGKLDYLRSLGVDVIWLAPFQPSPLRDDGYDVTDYYAIDSRTGTPGDYARFIYAARQKGLRVIMDLVLNHTSTKHPWFLASRSGKSSRYHDWYVWSKDRPSDSKKGMAFPGVEKETYTLDSVSHEYYYHRFYSFEPDLNYSNPEVRREALAVLRYWAKQGISGFRLDAVPFILEKNRPGVETPEHDYELLREMRRVVQSENGEAIILGEANVPPTESNDYFGEHGEGLQMMFNFYANQYLFYSLATQDATSLKKALTETRKIPSSAQWAYFLRNHDEIDLGRLSDQQRQFVFDKFGPEKDMQLYGRGIRRRLAPMLNNPSQLKMANSLLFSLPGAVVIRSGEEIAMGDDLSLKERLSVRTPMQWSAEKNAQFSNGVPFRKIISDGAYGYTKVNVAVQERDSSSLLSLERKLISIRKQCPEISAGEWEIVQASDAAVVVLRYWDDIGSVVTLHNLSGSKKEFSFTIPLTQLFDLERERKYQQNQDKVFKITLPPFGFMWLRGDKPVR